MKTACALLMAASCVLGQRPEIENAKVEARAFSGRLGAQVTEFGAGPYWVGYSEPIVAGRHGTMCDRNEMSSAPLRLEGQTAIVMLVRVESGRAAEPRIVSPDCRIEAGGLPFYWLEGVPAVESVSWLKTNATNSSIMAIALHAGSEADRAIEELIAVAQPERVREKAAFWIGNARGARGVELLNRMLASDPSERVREQAIFGLSQSKEPSAMERLVAAARSDKDPRIRSKALFWLAQKAGSLQTIRNAVTADPELSVKEQAVFALKQMPNNQGIPALIDVAKSHPEPAVRKKAMFWLGQSNDSRATDFFAQILKQ